MGSTPNTALQRTRAALLLRSARGELATPRHRRAPLSFWPFGDPKTPMALRIALAFVLVASGVRGATSQRLFVRVVDVECQPIQGVSVAFIRAGDPPGQVAITGVTDLKGFASFDAHSGMKYEIVASLRHFVPTRVGPFSVTPSRSSQPILLVLTLESPL